MAPMAPMAPMLSSEGVVVAMGVPKSCVALIMMSLLAAEAGSSEPPSGSHRGARLDGSLMRALESADPLEAAAAAGYRIRDRQLQVVILTDCTATETLRQWLEERGASHVSSTRSLLQASVDRQTLSALQTQPGVVWVRRPVYAELPVEPAGPTVKEAALEVTTEGLAAMNGPAWIAAGFTGQGVKVGIIDIGFGGYSERAGGELPPAGMIHLHTFGDTRLDSSVIHGTAMAEIIHDIAPDAELYLAIIDTDIDFAQAVDWMTGQGVEVVSMSLGWYFSGPGDGTGYVESLIAEQVVDHDVLWALPAGNHRDEHWQGTSIDQDGDGWIEFSDGKEILMLVNEESGVPEYFSSADDFLLRAYIRWNDWTTVDQDYTVCLFRMVGSTPIEADCSDETQNGGAGQQPCDYAQYRPMVGGYYGVGISRAGVTGFHDIDLHTPRIPRTAIEDAVGASSLTDPGSCPHGITTGAVDHRWPYPVFDYSAQGPTKGPGGTHEGGMMAPDLTGYSPVSNSRGEYRAAGTSAAVPHVGGAAALIRGARPGWSNLEVRRMLEQRAADIGDPGWDTTAGAGRLFLGGPIPPAGQCGASVSSRDGTLLAEGDSGTAVVTVSAGCPWFADSPTEWIHVAEGGAGSGNGTISYTVDANPTTATRRGVLFAAGSRVAIIQEGRDRGPVRRRPVGGVLVSERGNTS
jgi:hypothetical protein